MIELRFIYKPTPHIYNYNFNQYFNNWSGNTMATSAAIYPSLDGSGSLVSIDYPVGWTFNGGYAQSVSGSTEPIWQDIGTFDEGPVYDFTGNTFIQTGFTYGVKFEVAGVPENTGYGITPWLYNNSGETVYTSGTYTQYIFLENTGNTILFEPQDGFGGGITGIRLLPQLDRYLPIDLYDEKDQFNLTFQIASSIADKGATYSKTITLPGTPNNNMVFNMILDENIWNDLSAMSNGVVFINKKIDAGIYQDSVELITGFFEITSVIKKDLGKIEYEGTFYSNSKNLAATLGDKLLIGNDDSNDDLDFSAYNHRFTWTNITRTWGVPGVTQTFSNYTGSTGVYYPLIDFANISSGNIVKLENFKPSLYVKEVWDKIFSDAGFRYTSSFLNSTLFKSLTVPQGNARKNWDLQFNNTKFKVGRSTNYMGKEYPTGNQVLPYFEPMRYDLDHSAATYATSLFDPNEQWFPSGTTQPPAFSWKINSSGAWELNAFVRYGIWFDAASNPYQVVDPGNILKVYIRIVRKRYGYSDFVIKQVENIHTIPAGTYSYTGSGTFIVDSGSTYISCMSYEEWLNMDDEIYVQMALDVRGFYTKGSKWLYFVKTDETGPTPITCFYNTPIQKNYYMWNSMVYPSDALPNDMKQIDFLKSVSNKFNLTFAESKDDPKCLIIEPFDDFYYTGYTQSAFVDWTYKVDISKDKTIERIPFLLDKDIQFKFKKDGNDVLLKKYSDAISTEFGDKTARNIYYAESTEKVEDQFSSTITGLLGTTNYYVPKIYSQQDEYNGWPTDSDYNNRFLYRKYLNSTNYTGHTFPQLLIERTTTGSGGGTGSTYEYYQLFAHPYAGFQDNPYSPTLDLNYGTAVYYGSPFNTSNTLAWNYWRKKIAFYTDINSRMITCTIRLNPADIAALDWRKKVKIEGQYYQLYKIQDWNPNQGCKVQLLQLSTLNDSIYYDPENYMVSGGIGPGGVGGGGVGGGGVNVDNGTGSGSGSVMRLNPNTNVLNLQPPVPNRDYPIQDTAISDFTLNALTGITIKETLNQYPQESNGLIIGEGNRSLSPSFIIHGNDNISESDMVSILSSKNNKVSNNYVSLIGADDNDVQMQNSILIGSNRNTITMPTNPEDSGSTAATGFTNVIINSHDNTISDSRITMIASSKCTINSGLTDSFLVLTTGVTISADKKVYIKNKDFDDMADQTWVGANYFNKANDITMASGKSITIPDDAYLYFGDPSTNGSFRIKFDKLGTGKLIFQSRKAGVWTDTTTVVDPS